MLTASEDATIKVTISHCLIVLVCLFTQTSVLGAFFATGHNSNKFGMEVASDNRSKNSSSITNGCHGDMVMSLQIAKI